jgi:hypothetical protein
MIETDNLSSFTNRYWPRVLGAQLLLRNGVLRAHSLRVAPMIQALNASEAVSAGARRHLPRRTATTAAVVSTVNTVLAVTAQSRRAEGGMVN